MEISVARAAATGSSWLLSDDDAIAVLDIFSGATRKQ